MPNTLQFTTSPEHQEAHQELGVERQIRANLQDRWERLVAEQGEEVARQVWEESDELFRQAEAEHARFHPRREA